MPGAAGQIGSQQCPSPIPIPCQECGQGAERGSPGKAGPDLAAVLSYERGVARSCPCCRKGAALNLKRVGEEGVKKKQAAGRGKSSSKLPVSSTVRVGNSKRCNCQQDRCWVV
jgi:hypothetical protein